MNRGSGWLCDTILRNLGRTTHMYHMLQVMHQIFYMILTCHEFWNVGRAYVKPRAHGQEGHFLYWRCQFI